MATKKELPLTLCEAPAARRPVSEQHRRDAQQMKHTRDTITNRLASFASEFARLAETAAQGVQAERFQVAVQDIAEGGPLTAADLSRHTNFPGWLRRHAKQFEQLATTTAQIELAAAFREFTREVSSPAVKEIIQKPLVNELVEDIKAWMEGSSNGVPFAQLSLEGKKELLGVGIDWTDYINRGLAIETKETWRGIEAIIDNAIAGKPSEQWMAGAQNLGKAHDVQREPQAERQGQPRQSRPKGRDIDMDRG